MKDKTVTELRAPSRSFIVAIDDFIIAVVLLVVKAIELALGTV